MLRLVELREHLGNQRRDRGLIHAILRTIGRALFHAHLHWALRK